MAQNLGEKKQQKHFKAPDQKDWWTRFLQQEPTVNLVVSVEASPLGSENITNCAIRGGMRAKLKRGSLVKRENTQKDSVGGGS